MGTLRAAAPLCNRCGRQMTDQHARLHIRMSDIRLRQFEETSDGRSSSSSMPPGPPRLARLGDAKGAIELLVSEAYARRDHWRWWAFPGEAAEILLPPNALTGADPNAACRNCPAGAARRWLQGSRRHWELAVAGAGQG